MVVGGLTIGVVMLNSCSSGSCSSGCTLRSTDASVVLQPLLAVAQRVIVTSGVMVAFQCLCICPIPKSGVCLLLAIRHLSAWSTCDVVGYQL